MSLQTKIVALYTAIAAAINHDREIMGSLQDLGTLGANTSLVDAINTVDTLAKQLETRLDGLIDNSTPSADKVFSSQEVVDRLIALKDELLGGASAAFDTLKELEDALASADVSGLLSAIGNRVRFDQVQELDNTQKATARTNIGAASAADLTALSESIGDTDTDFAAAFNGLLSA